MRTPQPLPASLVGVAFTPSEARRAGLSASRLRARDLHNPFHGVHLSVSAITVRERCLAYRPLLAEGVCFSHETAAVLLGVPLPESAQNGPLQVAVEFPRSPPRARGVVGHSLGAVSGSVVDGLPVSTPAHFWCQLSGVLTREDLVAVGDHLVGARKRPALAALDELAAVSAELRRTKGARARAWALPRIRPGADSRPESLLRLFLEAQGYGGLQVNRPIPVGRRLVLHPDLSIPERRLAFEYEGDGHRVERRQWHADIERRDLLEAEGWRVVRVTAHDLFGDRDAFAERLKRFVGAVGGWGGAGGRRAGKAAAGAGAGA
ncbi:endonuclease domain-containing protein, partial [Leifsonia sp. NPDC056824]|uniref:endonuclease domain-containing protein n=1 Tax=Leifsonia sp. NPDC056824 TaxID=3345953 RepID=UPI0036B0ED3A